MVITQAGNNPKVRALVYVNAFAPDSGQSISDAAVGFPAEPGADAGIKDEKGFLLLPDAAVERYFAQDLTPVEQEIITATQPPWGIGCLTDKVTHAAWHEKPSWWVISENDHMINPKLQEKMADTLKAKVTKVKTSHVAMLADPQAVTAVIIAAADAVKTEKVDSGSAVESGLVLPRAAAADHAGFNPAPVVRFESQPPAAAHR